jgi:predicted nucleotidyltransferase
MAIPLFNVNQQIQAMVLSIVEHSHPLRIILFGSRARGTARVDSDVDLLVVLPAAGSSNIKKSAEIYAYLGPVGISKDIVVVTPEELEAYKDVNGTLIKPALQEGKVLYDHVA